MKRADPSLNEIFKTLMIRGVTYRRYGQHGELRRPMVHRFPASKLRCDGTYAGTVMLENMLISNALLRRLVRKGRNKTGVRS